MSLQDLEMLQLLREETDGNSKCYCRLGKNGLMPPPEALYEKKARKFTRTSRRTIPWNFIAMPSAPLTIAFAIASDCRKLPFARNFRNTLSTAGTSMTGSERPSPEPLLKKEASPAVLGGRECWKCSGAFKCLEFQGLGHPSRTLEGNSRKRSESVSGVFLEFFQNFLRKVPAVLGCGLEFP